MNEGLNMIGLNMSNIFLPLSLSLQERTFETKKNTSYFPSKALFFEIFKFKNFWILHFRKFKICHQMPNHETSNTFY